jgi:hypothetical protein
MAFWLIITYNFEQANISEKYAASIIYTPNMQAACTTDMWAATQEITRYQVPKDHGSLS